MASLTPETQAKIDKAFADLAAAKDADTAHDTARSELTAAMVKESSAADAALVAHKTSTDSAHDALAALAAELNFTLPG